MKLIRVFHSVKNLIFTDLWFGNEKDYNEVKTKLQENYRYFEEITL